MTDIIKFLSNISPYVRRAWDGNMLSGWQLKERVIFDYEFVYIMEGEAEIAIEDRVYKAIPGELYIIRPFIRHSISMTSVILLRNLKTV